MITFLFYVITITLVLLFSFLSTSAVYYLFSLVMINFFNINIPFSWNYAFGVWLIIILIRFVFGGSND